MSQWYVYILSNYRHTVYYVGVTNNLIRRIYEHKNKLTDGFTKRYNVTKLLYYEIFNDPENTIFREKQIKDHRREKKVSLISKMNPKWIDLYNGISQQ
jgi:putative endonuclease